MNSLIVYDSKFGNTEHIVQAIADTLSEYGKVRTVRVEHTHPLELEGVDLLLLGCPTQGWNASPLMRSFLGYASPETLGKVAVACFDTRFDRSEWLTGSAAKKMTARLRKLGIGHLLPRESFFVEGTQGPLKSGELVRAVNWARRLHILYEADRSTLKGMPA